jgi:predicted kinase
VGQGIYDATTTTNRTYDAVLARAREALESGRSAVVDATLPDPARRAPFLALAEALSSPVFVVEVTVPDSVTRDRLAARARHNDGPSDADLTVYEAARRTYLPPNEFPPSHRISVDGRASPETAAAHLLDAMIATTPSRRP